MDSELSPYREIAYVKEMGEEILNRVSEKAKQLAPTDRVMKIFQREFEKERSVLESENPSPVSFKSLSYDYRAMLEDKEHPFWSEYYDGWTREEIEDLATIFEAGG